ncbi:Ribosomal N-lysine methyltransferase set10 [Escovopsis weberi]|uniref:Ribosomal N-lysine methyltransferase set10 n=1 Tax=Escovopsis weberi TaxID=150374 RepID=A0A0M8N2P6_ESCWE|nr:Ribosomal N-lysine methyltransferase set10 [Escovopsis weberi]
MASQEAIATLVQWVASHGGHLHPAVEVYSDPATGLSLRVRPDCAGIDPLEPIVRLPTVLSLSYLNAVGGRPGPSLYRSPSRAQQDEGQDEDQGPQQDGDQSPAFPPDVMARTPPHVIGRLLLAREFLRGRRSPWWPYIEALPQPGDPRAWRLPAFWDDDAGEAELLAGTNLEVGIAKIRGDARREWAAARELLDEAGALGGLTQELHDWAFCVFSSRSFRPALVLPEREWGGGATGERMALPRGVRVDDFGVLLPLLDIGNHDMTAPARWVVWGAGEAEGERGGAGEREGGRDGETARGAVELVVDRAHGAGEQVFNNYSMKTNAELLLGYGFMVPATRVLHNDYVHVRRRGGDAGQEWLISRRPIGDASSMVVRAREGLASTTTAAISTTGGSSSGDGKKKKGEEEEEGAGGAPVLPCFERVQAGMVWDIFRMMAGEDGHEALIPLDGEAVPEERHEEERRRRFLAGRVSEDGRELLEQAAAVIQHKLLQELERLDETEVWVTGDEASRSLSPRARLALEYRRSCRQVLEGCLERMEMDGL